MRAIALTMVVLGAMLAVGAADEFRYFGPDAHQYWVGFFVLAASITFTWAGFQLARRGKAALPVVRKATALMGTAVIAAGLIGDLGRLALLISVVCLLAVALWIRSNSQAQAPRTTA